MCGYPLTPSIISNPSLINGRRHFGSRVAYEWGLLINGYRKNNPNFFSAPLAPSFRPCFQFHVKGLLINRLLLTNGCRVENLKTLPINEGFPFPGFSVVFFLMWARLQGATGLRRHTGCSSGAIARREAKDGALEAASERGVGGPGSPCR